MKPALYYAIRVNLYSTIVAVTSEKRNGTRWFGRDCQYNEATHGRSDQLRGRFATLADAEACREGVLAIDQRFDALLDEHRKATQRLHRECGDEIKIYIAEATKVSVERNKPPADLGELVKP